MKNEVRQSYPAPCKHASLYEPFAVDACTYAWRMITVRACVQGEDHKQNKEQQKTGIRSLHSLLTHARVLDCDPQDQQSAFFHLCERLLHAHIDKAGGEEEGREIVHTCL